jgi:hypothetical protein
MPQVIALALLGAGIYAGYRWFAGAARRLGEELQRGDEELQRQPAGRIEKDLGALEYDPVAGVYRPVRKP